MKQYKCIICCRAVIASDMMCRVCFRAWNRVPFESTLGAMQWAARRAVREFKLLQQGKKYR